MYTLLVIGWMVYFAIHSILACNYIKQKIAIKLPALNKYYRILYNCIAIIGLLPLAYFSIFIEDNTIFKSNILTIIGYIVVVVGIGLLIQAFSVFNLKEFFGIQQLQATSIPQQEQLVVKGMYQYVRHPLYFGLIVLFTGIFLIMPTYKIALVCVITFVYLIIGSSLEEKKLQQQFGDEYTTYTQNVKRLIPYIY